MKKMNVVSCVLNSLLLLIVICVLCVEAKGTPGEGIALSGAGGRIGQLIGLAEVLMLGNYPGGKAFTPKYLSGASSGSITAVMINAVIESQETHRLNVTWDYVKNILFQIQTSDIIDDSVTGILQIEKNIRNGFVLDNTPMINFLKKQFNQMGYIKFGDLYVPTSISLVNQSSGLSNRFWSDDPQWANLDLLELVMTSCALPIAFSPRKVQGLGDTNWIDGGTGIDTLPVFSLLHREEVKSMYIISYGSALTSGGDTVPDWLDSVLLLKNAMAVFDDMRVEMFLGGIDMVSSQEVIPSYSYIPHLNQTFSVLDFADEKLEYTLAYQWAKENPPEKLN